MFFFWVCESLTHQFLLLSIRISYPATINRPTERKVLWLQTNHNYLWACFFFRNLKWHAFKNIWFSTYPCILVSFKSNFAFDIKGLSIWPVMVSRKKQKNPNTHPSPETRSTFFLMTNRTWYEIFYYTIRPLSIAKTLSAGSLIANPHQVTECSRTGAWYWHVQYVLAYYFPAY